MSSSEYIIRCLDVMTADPNLSENTKIIMFMEYFNQKCQEAGIAEWKDFKTTKPSKQDVYEVCWIDKGKGQAYEYWNGYEFSLHNESITHWRELRNPNQ